MDRKGFLEGAQQASREDDKNRVENINFQAISSIATIISDNKFTDLRGLLSRAEYKRLNKEVKGLLELSLT